MNINERVLKIIEQEGITTSELLQMVKRAAITSQEGGNRKFHNWVFQIDNFEVTNMRRSEMRVDGIDQGRGYMTISCLFCSGWGCKLCGWWGKTRQPLLLVQSIAQESGIPVPD